GDLNLDVPGPRDQPLAVDGIDAECAARLRAAARVGLGQRLALRHHPHAATAPAAHGLDDDTRAGRLSVEEGLDFLETCIATRGRHHWHIAATGELERLCLVAEEAELFGRRPHETDAGLGAGTGEILALAQEPVARVHG